MRVARPNIPAHVEASIARALEKLPADRFTSAHEFAEALHGRIEVGPFSTIRERTGSTRLRWAAATILVITGGLVGTEVTRRYQRSTNATVSARASVLRASIDLPVEAPLALGSAIPDVGYYSPVIALSPDGAWLAYVAQAATGTLLYLRDMASGETRAVPGPRGRSIRFSHLMEHGSDS